MRDEQRQDQQADGAAGSGETFSAEEEAYEAAFAAASPEWGHLVNAVVDVYRRERAATARLLERINAIERENAALRAAGEQHLDEIFRRGELPTDLILALGLPIDTDEAAILDAVQDVVRQRDAYRSRLQRAQAMLVKKDLTIDEMAKAIGEALEAL